MLRETEYLNGKGTMKVQPIGTVSKERKLRRDSSQDPIIDEAIQMLTPDIEIVLDHITVKVDDVNLKQTMRNRNIICLFINSRNH